jgi:hypothetical protein
MPAVDESRVIVIESSNNFEQRALSTTARPEKGRYRTFIDHERNTRKHLLVTAIRFGYGIDDD